LILAGVDVARLNFSHGTHEEHAVRIDRIRQLSHELHKPVTILQDLQGPKLRVGTLPPDGIVVKIGQEVVLLPVDEDGDLPAPQGNEIQVPLHVPNLARSVKAGNHILLDDGQLEFEVVRVDGDAVHTRVLLGGLLKATKALISPAPTWASPDLPKKIVPTWNLGFPWASMRLPFHSCDRQQTWKPSGQPLKHSPHSSLTRQIIAKMELPEAIENMHEIIHLPTALMVARGDLGVEMSPQSVPIIQKKIIGLPPAGMPKWS